MKRQWGTILRGIWKPVLLACFVIRTLLVEMINYEPHYDCGFVIMLVSGLVGVIALVSLARAYKNRNMLRCGAWGALLALCLLCCLEASRVPFCPMCDGECKSLLLRWIHPDIMNP